MALVSSIEPSRKERQTVHQPTRCLSSIVEGPGGKRYIQLDTYGSDQRQQPEKSSQSIQFDKQAAGQLLKFVPGDVSGIGLSHEVSQAVPKKNKMRPGFFGF